MVSERLTHFYNHLRSTRAQNSKGYEIFEHKVKVTVHI